MAYRGLGAAVLRLAAALPSVTRLVCVSHFVRRHTESLLSKSAGEKLAVIENAMPRGAEDTASDMQPGNLSRIAVVGRLVPDKGKTSSAPCRAFAGRGVLPRWPFENADPVSSTCCGDRCKCEVGRVSHPVIGTWRHRNPAGPFEIAEAAR
jgi:hypothetical protein